MTALVSRCAEVLDAVREQAPLVHCIVAAVSMNYVANALLAAGARPMMTETEAEAPHLVGCARGLLINLGTLSTDATAGIEPTVAAARASSVPWVLDPTAIGRAPVRTPLARRLVTLNPAVVRCNASEALVLVGVERTGAGPDSAHSVAAARSAAVSVARDHDTVVAVSGASDVITDGDTSVQVGGGSSLLTRVTGTGCALGALTAACVAVAPDALTAAVTSHAWMAAAGGRAALNSGGPGSFAWQLLDALDAVKPDDIKGLIHAC